MLLNYGMEEAGFHAIRRSILNTSAFEPGHLPGLRRNQAAIGGAIKMELAENFVIPGCSSRPLTRPVFVGRDYVLTLPARKYTARVWRHPEKCLGALQVSC